MKIYSKRGIYVVSVLITIAIYAFCVVYMPKLIKTVHDYLYYKSQPTIEREYEETM